MSDCTCVHRFTGGFFPLSMGCCGVAGTMYCRTRWPSSRLASSASSSSSSSSGRSSRIETRLVWNLTGVAEVPSTSSFAGAVVAGASSARSASRYTAPAGAVCSSSNETCESRDKSERGSESCNEGAKVVTRERKL
eukprot:1187616-Prorocentrum_minimum.AAC.11